MHALPHGKAVDGMHALPAKTAADTLAVGIQRADLGVGFGQSGGVEFAKGKPVCERPPPILSAELWAAASRAWADFVAADDQENNKELTAMWDTWWGGEPAKGDTDDTDIGPNAENAGHGDADAGPNTDGADNRQSSEEPDIRSGAKTSRIGPGVEDADIESGAEGADTTVGGATTLHPSRVKLQSGTLKQGGGSVAAGGFGEWFFGPLQHPNTVANDDRVVPLNVYVTIGTVAILAVILSTVFPPGPAAFATVVMAAAAKSALTNVHASTPVEVSAPSFFFPAFRSYRECFGCSRGV
jgi:hypothetical protein